MPTRSFLLAVTLLAAMVPAAWAQLGEDAPPPPKRGESSVQRWRIGIVLTANGGAFRSITATSTVPIDWPEQRVRIAAEDLSPGVKVSYQPIEDLGKQMVMKIPHLAAGAEARAVVTFEIKRIFQSAPENTDVLVLPDPKKLDRKTAAFLAPGPYIESNRPEIKAIADEVGADKEKAWEKVEAIYRWVQKKIKYEDNQGKEIKTALGALQAGKGDCDEITSLFIAVCRATGVPARTVRVPRHCYPEFYLLDEQGEGHWFPCQSAGTPSFGSMPDLRPILQKGDNVLLPGPDPRSKRKTRYRFFPENVVGFPVGSGGSLRQQMICELERKE